MKFDLIETLIQNNPGLKLSPGFLMTILFWECIPEHTVHIIYNDKRIFIIFFNEPLQSDQFGFVDDYIEDIELLSRIEPLSIHHRHSPSDFTIDQCPECFGF